MYIRRKYNCSILLLVVGVTFVGLNNNAKIIAIIAVVIIRRHAMMIFLGEYLKINGELFVFI